MTDDKFERRVMGAVAVAIVLLSATLLIGLVVLLTEMLLKGWK